MPQIKIIKNKTIIKTLKSAIAKVDDINSCLQTATHDDTGTNWQHVLDEVVRMDMMTTKLRLKLVQNLKNK